MNGEIEKYINLNENENKMYQNVLVEDKVELHTHILEKKKRIKLITAISTLRTRKRRPNETNGKQSQDII